MAVWHLPPHIPVTFYRLIRAVLEPTIDVFGYLSHAHLRLIFPTPHLNNVLCVHNCRHYDVFTAAACTPHGAPSVTFATNTGHTLYCNCHIRLLTFNTHPAITVWGCRGVLL